MSSTQARDLSKLTIRLVTDPSEVAQWNALVARHHYLGSSRMMGEQLRYVAELDGCWAACLGWSAAALKLSSRDEWIGWSPILRRQRLHLVAQNARFLVLPGFQIPNLASRCLGLNVRCLSSDWQAQYGHPVWLAETFVESGRNDGTCYRACGWMELGETKGFRRTHEGYRKHGLIKKIFVKELIPGGRKHLNSSLHHAEDRPVNCIEFSSQPVEGSADGRQPSVFSIIAQHVKDPRKTSGQSYRLDCLLALLLTGFLAGETTTAGVAVWAKRLKQRDRERLRCPCKPHRGYIVPTANTFRYLLQDLNPGEIEAAIRAWVTACGINITNTHIAIDGKVLRGSAHDDQPAKAQLNALQVDTEIVIDQQAIPAKTNEITAIRDLLRRHDLTGTIVSADAAHTNTETANLIAEKGGSMCSSSKKINLAFSTRSKAPSRQQASVPTPPPVSAATAATKSDT